MKAPLELRQMHYVVCLAQEGNVTRAARRLNIVQPALSMQIAKLERSLGQKLFERIPQGVRPTAAGERLVELVAPILRDAEAATQAMQHGEGQIAGRVTIGLVASVAQCTMAQSAARAARTYPEIQLCVSEGYTETLVDWVSTGQLETAVINAPRARLPVAVAPILDEEMVLACRKDALDIPADLGLGHLERLCLASPSKRHGLRKVLDDAAAAQGIALRPRLELDNIAALCDVVATTDLVTILPSVAVRKDIQEGRMDAYRFTSSRLVRSVAVARHPRRALSRAGAAILDLITSDLLAAAATAAKLIRTPPAGRRRFRRPAGGGGQHRR
ncbi:MAG: LysR family transcriptional regulator [Hyphomicrobiaceae bacterium]|nr:LysR family transcriptional regulator [Hyphomicrobiaceae bacterium]